MEKLIKSLSGLSGDKVELFKKEDDLYFIRKSGNIGRNIERLGVLKKNNFNVPEIYRIEKNFYEMEYIFGIDMGTYLLYNEGKDLLFFLLDSLEKMHYIKNKNYKETYEKKLASVSFVSLPFSKEQLINRLPEELPQSLYHGDFTFDNILYSPIKKKFYMIDPLESDYDSFSFDIGKLRQDTYFGWFNRKTQYPLMSKLMYIDRNILNKFSFLHDYVNTLTILMLLRVLPYVKSKKDEIFLHQRIHELWT